MPSPRVFRPSTILLALAWIACALIVIAMLTVIFEPRFVLLWALAL